MSVCRDFDFFYNTTTENQLFSLYEIDDWTPERGYASSAPYDIYPFRSPGMYGYVYRVTVKRVLKLK